MGYVYLLHYERPLQAGRPRQENRHYFGYASRDVWQRIERHATGMAGATFTRVAHERGIPFTVAGIWRGATQHDERSVKRQKHLARICRLCDGQPNAVLCTNGSTLAPLGGVVRRWLALQSDIRAKAPLQPLQTLSWGTAWSSPSTEASYTDGGIKYDVQIERTDIEFHDDGSTTMTHQKTRNGVPLPDEMPTYDDLETLPF